MWISQELRSGVIKLILETRANLVSDRILIL